MLKTRVLRYLILVALAYAHAQDAAGQSQSAAWSRYTYPGEEFSVELPGVPSLFNTARAAGRMPFSEAKVRVFSLYHDDVVYFVVAYDAPRSSESLDYFATLLRGAWGLAPKGKLESSEFEGSSYSVVGTQRGRLTYDLHGEARAFRAKRHAYLLLAFSNAEGREEVARFLNSFSLGESPEGQPVPDEEPVPRFVPPKTPNVPPGGLMLGPGHGGAVEPPAAGDRRAMIVYKPEPGYTEEARKKGISGTVILRAVLSSDGTVTEIEPTKWLSNGLTERAIRVARQMRFFPAMKGGQPVSQSVTLEYNFNVY